MESKNAILDRVLEEVKLASDGGEAVTTDHSVYVSGLFEQEDVQDKNATLDRVLSEIKAADQGDTQATTTDHSVYVSGLFERDES